MFDSILISVLKTFSAKEVSQFEKFISSPYFTGGERIRSQIVINYFHTLKKFHPEFTGKNFTKEILYAKIHPGSKYNDVRFRKINSDLLKLAEKFLIQLELEGNETVQRKYLLSQSYKRNLEKLFNRVFNSMLTHLNGLKKDEDYFFETYWVWKSYWDFYVGKLNYSRMDECINNINNFFFYFLLVSLRIYLWGTSFFWQFESKYKPMMSDEVLDYVERNIESIGKYPQILIIYNLIMLVTKKDENYFNNLKDLKAKHLDSLVRNDKLNIFIMMRNYCHDKILSGHSKFRRERFELDKEFFGMLKQAGDKIHVFGLLSTIKNANRLNEFEWVEGIIEDFESYCSRDEIEFGKNYTIADNFFLKKRYDEALEHLSTIKTLYSTQKQYVRNLTLQIYYETSSFEEALSLIDTSKHFLKRDNQLSENNKSNSLNFIKFLEKLIHLNERKSSNEDYEVLKLKILENENVQNKDWLIEKFNS